ncbi:putative KHG/KDPG aldolase [Symbiodinium microadriaticum]|uniref:Putative KHG/KDPG aldolase n=1 Tax=Symbiodinium microadriaticum TaxID=2951 RepID=A0A1Q9CNX0_SYMMI|nr:putative KHG/KDPG aldolase [Symbiodinium microadriaticum]
MEGGHHAWTGELPERCRGQQQVLQAVETHHQPLQWRAALACQADNTADRGCSGPGVRSQEVAERLKQALVVPVVAMQDIVVFRTAAAEEALRRMAAAEPTALVVNWCLETGVAVIPGVATPTEVETALRLGLSVLKFFPAEANGGVNALKAISAPYGQISWMPTGGVSENNLEKLGLEMPQRDAVAQGNWRYVKELSQRARQLAQSIALKKRGK